MRYSILHRRRVLTLEELGERITPGAGQLDTSFGTGGIVRTSFGSTGEKGQSVVIDDAGHIVIAGFTTDGANADIALAKYQPDGSPDLTFGNSGKLTTPIGAGNDFGLAAVIDGAGRIVVAGFSSNGANFDFVIVRYLPDGQLDQSFGGQGFVTTRTGTGDAKAYGVAVDHLGRIVVSGQVFNGSNVDIGIARYLEDGTLDSTFSDDGIAIVDVRGTDDFCTAVAIDFTNRVLLTGSSFNGANHDVMLVRLNSDGTLDSSFDGDGKVITPMGPRDDGGTTILIDDLGRIVVGGRTFNGFNFDMMAARYNPDGSPDLTFDTDGRISVEVGPGEDYGERIAIDPVGRIVLVGSSANTTNLDVALVRFNPNGTLDSSFNVQGKVTTSIGPGDDIGLGVALDDHGRIVVTGTSSNGSDLDIVVLRYLTNFHLEPGSSTHTLTEDDPPLAVDNALQITNSPNANLANATVQIGNFVRSEDVLDYTLQGGITADFNSLTGLLTLSGSASIADYQAVLRSLTYANTSQSPLELDRTVTITVDDGEATNNLASATYTIHIVARNDAPGFSEDGVLAPIRQQNIVLPGQTFSAIFSKLNTDPDDGDFLKGIAVIGNTANDGTEGVWQYSTDSGATWFDIGAVADDNTALALSTATRIRFVPIPAFTGRPTPLIVRAIDSTFTDSFTAGATRETVDASNHGGVTPIAGSTNMLETQVFPYGTGNIPPTLVGVPVSVNINEGETLIFTASSSDPDLGQTRAFNLDGAPPTATIDPDTGAFSWLTVEDDGPKTFIFKVQVTDGFDVVEKTVTVFVHEVNQAPTLANVPSAISLVRGQTHTFTATVTDPDVLNGFGNALAFSVDGSPPTITVGLTTGVVTVALPENISAGQTISATIRVTDDGVPERSDAKTMIVAALAAAMVNGDLVIGGTDRNDLISVVPTRDGSQLLVILNRSIVGQYPLAGITGRVVIHGLGGNDRIMISPRITKASDLYGDAGNDVLVGGSGDDRLFGDAGNDRLIGGRGNDLSIGGDGNDFLTDALGTNVLFGGSGSDRLIGGNGDDLLIGGPTNYDSDLGALGDIRAEWISGSSYDDRVSHLKGPLGGANGTTFLTPTTVQDDFDRDVVLGGRGSDFFVVSALDLFDLRTGEQKLDV